MDSMISAVPVLNIVGSQSGADQIYSASFSHVREKILKEDALPEAAVDQAIAEYRKFLHLIYLGYDGLAMCSREVDEVWHTHILFTRSYINFCDRVFGRYIHHLPATETAPTSREAVECFRTAYQEHFGELPSIWGFFAENCSMCGGGPSCGQCGEGG